MYLSVYNIEAVPRMFALDIPSSHSLRLSSTPVLINSNLNLLDLLNI